MYCVHHVQGTDQTSTSRTAVEVRDEVSVHTKCFGAGDPGAWGGAEETGFTWSRWVC